MPEDYYSLLGVEPDADEAAILEAYRELAGEHHSDVSDDPDAEARFRRLNRAKSVLTDPERRRAYDRLGHGRFVEREEGDQRSPGEREAPSSPNAGPPPGADSFVDAVGWPADVGSLVERLFGVAGDQGAPIGGRRRSPGSGLASPFEVDLSSAFRAAGPGGARHWTATHGAGPAARRAESGGPGTDEGERGRECPKCGGRGTFVHVLDTARGRTRRLQPCERCDGAGTIVD